LESEGHIIGQVEDGFEVDITPVKLILIGMAEMNELRHSRKYFGNRQRRTFTT
jgi:hypothetical protein